MTLQQLSYFVFACRFGNISRAAEHFGVSQPSVSSAIKALENEFGVTLIRRQKTGFLLTEDGKTFRALAESLVEHADGVEKAMKSRGEKRHHLRLGVPPMISSLLLPVLYSRFSELCPETEIFTQEIGREELLFSLDNGRLDVALLPHTQSFPAEYEAIFITDLETVCCVPPRHPLAVKKSVDAKALETEKLILFSKGFFHTERIFLFFSEAGIEPNVLHTSSQLSTVEQFVSEDMAVGFLFRQIAEQNQKMVPISLDPPMVSKISLVFRKDQYYSKEMKEFVRCVQEFSFGK